MMCLDNTRECIVYYLMSMMVVFVSGCERNPDDYAIGRTRSQLYYLTTLTALKSFKTNQPPPENLSAFVDWLKDDSNTSAERRYIDYENKTITDGWGNPIRVIYENGRYIGLGSSGPDGKWQDNSGDDIFSPRREDRDPPPK